VPKLSLNSFFKKEILLISLISLLAGCAEDPSEGVSSVSENAECVSQKIDGQYIVKFKDGRMEKVLAESDQDLFENKLKEVRDQVERVERNYSIPLSDFKIETTALNSDNWGFDAVSAQAVITQGYDGAGVVVAVVDTGVDVEHPQLIHNIWVNQAEKNGVPGVDDDGNGFVDDVNGWNFGNSSSVNEDEIGHGTHVAGVIAANSNFGLVKGVAPKAKIMAVDFMSEFGGTDADAVAALDYAMKAGAKIVNASWGSARCSQAVQDKFVELKDAGVFVSVAAGNSGSDLTYRPEYPAVYNSPSQITVGASTLNFFRASFSNYGLPVHMVAPGKDILSTVPAHISSNGTATMSGTSMAAPYVAGVAALLLSYDGTLDFTKIKSAILSSLAPGRFGVRFDGELRADRALEAIKAP
jgi:subtilisin family serine protease